MKFLCQEVQKLWPEQTETQTRPKTLPTAYMGGNKTCPCGQGHWFHWDAHPLGQIVFIFMQFSAKKIGQIIG